MNIKVFLNPSGETKTSPPNPLGTRHCKREYFTTYAARVTQWTAELASRDLSVRAGRGRRRRRRRGLLIEIYLHAPPSSPPSSPSFFFLAAARRLAFLAAAFPAPGAMSASAPGGKLLPRDAPNVPGPPPPPGAILPVRLFASCARLKVGADDAGVTGIGPPRPAAAAPRMLGGT